MVLRFQGKDDDVDRAALAGRRGLIIQFVLIAVFFCVASWLSGDSLHSYGEALGVGLVCFWAVWEVYPAYYEMHARSRETYGMVSEIEKTVNALRRDIADMRAQLEANLVAAESSRPGGFSESSGLSGGFKHLDKVEREMRDGARLDEIRVRDSK